MMVRVGGILGDRHIDPSRSGIPKRCLSAMTIIIHKGMIELIFAMVSSDGWKYDAAA